MVAAPAAAAGIPHVSSPCDGAGGCPARLTGSAPMTIHRRLRHSKRPMPLADLERDPARSPPTDAAGAPPTPPPPAPPASGADTVRGRCDRSANLPDRRPRICPARHAGSCRDTPIAAATSVTVRPYLITARTPPDSAAPPHSTPSYGSVKDQPEPVSTIKRSCVRHQPK